MMAAREVESATVVAIEGQVTVRLPASDLAWIESRAQQLGRELGRRVSKATVARQLVEDMRVGRVEMIAPTSSTGRMEPLTFRVSGEARTWLDAATAQLGASIGVSVSLSDVFRRGLAGAQKAAKRKRRR